MPEKRETLTGLLRLYSDDIITLTFDGVAVTGRAKDLIAKQLILHAARGELEFIKYYYNRLEGMPKVSVEVDDRVYQVKPAPAPGVDAVVPVQGAPEDVTQEPTRLRLVTALAGGEA